MARAHILLLASLASFFAARASPLAPNATLDARATHYGRGTWFHVGLGNCGKWNQDSDPIVAISIARYNSNGGANCDQWIEIVDTANNRRAYGLTRDSCQSCGYDDIDMSPGLFSQLDSLNVGRIGVSWHFMSKGWSP